MSSSEGYSVQVTFAMLEVLAERPDGCAKLDDLLQEMTSAKGQDRSKRFSELDSVDVLQAGLVVEENESLRITDSGRSVLRALEAFSQLAPETETIDRSRSLKKIDNLVGAGIRQKVFDLDLRNPDANANFEPMDEETNAEPDLWQPAMEVHTEDEPASTSNSPLDELSDTGDPTNAVETNMPAFVPIVPSFLKREIGTFEPRTRSKPRPYRKYSYSYALIASNLKRLGGILRGHVAHQAPNVKTGSPGGGMGGVVLSLLATLVIIICAGTFIAVNQIKSLKSEISTLEKKLVSLKKQSDSDQQRITSSADQKNPSSLASTEKGRPAAENRPASSALTLSPDEIRQVREYIKPAPFTTAVAKPISVGDPVTTGTIPLPSSLTDKIPKLLGARFTIYDGTIIILKRDSHQADAVLGPH
jgi:hypothetical protein